MTCPDLILSVQATRLVAAFSRDGSGVLRLHQFVAMISTSMCGDDEQDQVAAPEGADAGDPADLNANMLRILADISTRVYEDFRLVMNAPVCLLDSNLALLLRICMAVRLLRSWSQYRYFQVRDAFTRFDADHALRITPAELKRGMHKGGFSDFTDADAAAVFELFDTDRSGGLSFVEFIHVLGAAASSSR